MAQATQLPAPNVAQRALATRKELSAVEKRWTVRVGATVGTWAFVTLLVAFVLTGGPSRILGAWLAVLRVGLLTTPIMGVVLWRVNHRMQAEREALMAGEDAELELTHLPREVADFCRETRGVRLALMHVANHQEGIRELWDWLHSLIALQESHEELLHGRGVGAGPVGDILNYATANTPDLNFEQLASCVAHLHHVEISLAHDTGEGYR